MVTVGIRDSFKSAITLETDADTLKVRHLSTAKRQMKMTWIKTLGVCTENYAQSDKKMFCFLPMCERCVSPIVSTPVAISCEIF